MDSFIKEATQQSSAPVAPHQIDAELENILSKQRAKIKVVGTGGAGNNTINRIQEIGITGVDTIALNTDAQDLLYTNANHKILIGKEVTQGLGAGSIPQIGEESAHESEHDIKSKLQGADMVFITCGLGGGTGTGSAPVVAEQAKKVNALTVAVVTVPFEMEGQRRWENAQYGLEKLESTVDTLIVVPNDKLLELAPDLPLHTAFTVADEILTNAVKGIAELVTKTGLINLDYADLKTILSRGGAAMIGLGESKSSDKNEARALEAVENALTSPLLDVEITGAPRALVNVIGGADMTLREAEMIVETVSSKIHSSAHIIWGAMIDENIPRNQIQAMVVVAGGKFPYLENPDEMIKGDGPIDLGIEFTG